MCEGRLLSHGLHILVVSDSGGTGVENEILGFGFAGVEEVVGGDGTTRAGSVGRGGVSEMSIGIRSWISGVGANSETSVGAGSGTKLALPVVAFLPRLSWHLTRGLVFFRILPTLG